MKTLFRTLVPGLLLFSLLGGSALAQTRIATIDLRKVFDNYWKKTQAEAALKERQADMEKEDKNMLSDYKKMKDDYTALMANTNDQNASPEEREKRKKAAEDKLRQMKELEETITQYESQARKTLAEQSQRMRSNILGEIRTVVTAKAKVSNFSLVVDTAAESINSTPVFLYANNENDITDLVLKELNATAPADTSKQQTPAVKTDTKDSKK
jgi:outer membrane protein